MCKNIPQLLAILIGLTLSLAGCKKQAAEAPAASSAQATPTAAAAPATQATTTTAAPAPAERPVPAPPATATPTNSQTAADKSTFDPNSVPLTTKAVPPFPYLSWPEKLSNGFQFERELDFDRVYVIVGTELRPVEGRINKRHYPLNYAKLSRLAAERNYEAAMKDLGATQVSQLELSDEFKAAHKDSELDRLGIHGTYGKYNSYLLRTPETNFWIVIKIDDDDVSLVAIEEKQMTQSVKPLTAGAM